MEIHEHIIVDGTVGKMNTKLFHLQNESYEQMLDKHFEYAKWEAKRYVLLALRALQHSEKKLNTNLINKFFLFICLLFFQYFVLLGFLDGFEGYKYAKIKFKYFKKVYELLRK